MQKDRTNNNNITNTRPHKNDVLSGRGVSIANHPGNLRFRTLVTTYIDESYCFSFTSSEKKAIALDIVKHISKLDPPGRFLKRIVSKPKGLEGPWFVMDEKEIIKKTCQALRDCNRLDRTGYATGVREPEDVKLLKAKAEKEGLSVKDRAKAAIKQNMVLNRDEDKFSKPKQNGTIRGEVGRGKVLLTRENTTEGDHASISQSNPYPTRYATTSRMESIHIVTRNVYSPSNGRTKVKENHQNNHHYDYQPSSSTGNGHGYQLYDTHHQQHNQSSNTYYDNYYGHSLTQSSHSTNPHGASSCCTTTHFSPMKKSHDRSTMSFHPASKMNTVQSNFNQTLDLSLDYFHVHNRSSDPLLPPVKKQRKDDRESHLSTIVSKSTSNSSPITPQVTTDNTKSYVELQGQFFPESSSTDYNDIDDEYLLTNVDLDSHELADALNLF
jgi:hypothetical protein